MSGRIAVVAPATGRPLGSVPRADGDALRAAADVARRVQPLWAAVPVTSRAAVLRRAAQAVLDEVQTLAGLLAGETGHPRTALLLGEVLPSVSGLHALAADAPAAVRERRDGRRTALVPAPMGVVGLRGGTGSPWAEPLLETAAAVVTGNAVVLVPGARLAGDRLAAIFARAGAPEELVTVLHGALDLHDACDAVASTDPPARTSAMLVLDAGPAPEAVAAALPVAIVAPRERAGAVAAELAAAVRRLRLGDPLEPATEAGPLSGEAEVAAVEAAVAAAEAAGAERLCGGPVDVAGLPGAFFVPAVLRGGPPLLDEPLPGPVAAVVEAAGEDEAIALADTAPAVSVWTRDRVRGERIARRLHAELTWVNEHGQAAVAPSVRLARHLRSRSIASRAPLPRMPADPQWAEARVALARLAHGRESERWDALRSGAAPLARTALRLARSFSGRR